MVCNKVEMPIFITGMYRAGTTLLSRMLNSHPKLSITYDNIHFMRFIYNKYNPLNLDNAKRCIEDLVRRVENRYGLILSKRDMLHELYKFDKLEYSDLYNLIMNEVCLKDGDKSIWGEKTNVAWGTIPNFLEMFPKGKCFFIVRDPRDVLCSFKKMTNTPWPSYLDSIFASLDALQKATEYKNSYSKESIFVIQYEDLVLNPQKYAIEMCEFMGIKFSPNMLDTNSFDNILGGKWTANTSYEVEMKGISDISVNKWKKIIKNEELLLLEAILNGEMSKFNYTPSKSKFSVSDILKTIQIINSSELLKSRFKCWLEEGKGVESYPNNPLDSKNWG